MWMWMRYEWAGRYLQISVFRNSRSFYVIRKIGYQIAVLVMIIAIQLDLIQ